MKKLLFNSIFIIWMITILLIAGILVFVFQVFNIENTDSIRSLTEYKYHFVLIVENEEDPFWQEVYSSMKEKGEENGAYVELLGDNISDEYSLSELMEIAIYEKVDGIMIEPSREDSMGSLIDQAKAAGIPVVTLMSDVQSSSRQTFVGISKYNLGEKYGEEILKIYSDLEKNTDLSEDLNPESPFQVVVLEPNRDESVDGNEQIYAGIKSVVNESNIQINSIELDTVSAFGSEEYIRNIIMGTSINPDVIVCVNLVQTESTCQATIDFNKVGEIHIIGYFLSNTVIDAIDKGVIDSTFVVNTKEIGEESIASLLEYYQNKRVTDYISINVEKIDETNVSEYLDVQE